MKSMNITVRGVDEKIFKEFKAEAVREGKKIGEALNEAMRVWLMRKRAKKLKLLDLKPFDWGEGTERLSVEVDQIIYGE
jgi:hypothetical protein